jgi:hypothetical protein
MSSSPDRSATSSREPDNEDMEELGAYASKNSSYHEDNSEGERFEEEDSEEETFEEEHSEGNSTNDPRNEERGRVSSDSSPDTEMSTKKIRYDISERFHNDAAMREKERAFQRKLYNDNKVFPKTVDVESSIKRIMKEKVYPRLKILSDTESQFRQPDFVGKPVDQSRVICDVLSQELDLHDSLENKVRFWITYRSLVKNQLVKYRSNCVEDLKREYFRGEDLLINI